MSLPNDIITRQEGDTAKGSSLTSAEMDNTLLRLREGFAVYNVPDGGTLQAYRLNVLSSGASDTFNWPVVDAPLEIINPTSSPYRKISRGGIVLTLDVKITTPTKFVEAIGGLLSESVAAGVNWKTEIKTSNFTAEDKYVYSVEGEVNISLPLSPEPEFSFIVRGNFAQDNATLLCGNHLIFGTSEDYLFDLDYTVRMVRFIGGVQEWIVAR